MRVTQQQLYQPLLTGARDSAANVQDARAKIASGKRVNTTSDDPLAARRIIRFQDRLSNIDKFLVNARDSEALLQTETGYIEDVNKNLLRARELVNQASNGFFTQAERDAIASEINVLLEQILADGNAKLGDDYIFAGSKSSTKPFVASYTNGEITSVAYKGDREITNYRVGEGATLKVKESGARIYVDSTGGSSTTSVTFAGNLDTGTAVSGTVEESVNVFDSNGNIHTLKLTYTKDSADEYSVSVSSKESGVLFSDAALGSVAFVTSTGSFSTHTDATAGINVDFGLGSQVINFDFSGMSQVSKGVDISLDSKDGKAGGYGVFDVLIAVRDTMKNKDNLSQEAQIKEISAFLTPLDKVSSHIFDKMSEVGARLNSVEVTKNRLEDLRIRIEELRSADEDADVVELISELTSQEAVYQATLASGARISRISLLNFL